MKFEHVLQIYWTKGFFFGGNLFYTNQTLTSLLIQTPGLSIKTNKLLIQRFELTTLKKNYLTLLPQYENKTQKILLKPLNIFLSQIHTVNNTFKDLLRLVIMRMYLIKSYKGRCHAIGKPVHGQRTWSNGWNSYNTNKVLRYFIIEIKKKSNIQKTTEKINYKVITKKYSSKKKSSNNIILKKQSQWF